MAPNSHVVVTLKLPSDKLKEFDFSENKAPALKKQRKRAAPGTGSRARKPESEDFADEDTKPSINGSSGIVNSGTDPILGSLPRSLKAAPVANTAGLVLDKKPCRKWIHQVIELKTISGYSIGVKGWTSSYTPAEWEMKLKRDAEHEQAAEERAETPEVAATSVTAAAKKPAKVRKSPTKKPGSKRGTKPKDATAPSSSTGEAPEPLPDTEHPSNPEESQVNPSIDVSMDVSVDQSADPSAYPSENSSDPVSEPASEAPSEPASELASEPAET